MTEQNNVLDRLYSVIEAHKSSDPETSYTAKLFSQGLPSIAEKVGEESVEIIVAALVDNEKRVIEESADLLYHLLVLGQKRELNLLTCGRNCVTAKEPLGLKKKPPE